MEQVILLNKKEGITPLEALEVFRRKHQKYKDVKMTYAGRLDPMASGLLLVLADEECKNKDKYLKLDKEYVFEVLFGFATDTHDILGKVTNCARQDLTQLTQDKIEKAIKKNLKFFKGKITQKYPIYSSKTVAGKQLWQYAREGGDVEVPEKEVMIKSFNFIKLKRITSKKLLEDITKRINKVNQKNDFRQKEILKIWHDSIQFVHHVQHSMLHRFYIAEFKIKCSSGTYVRSISCELGERVGIPTLAYKIKRTGVGRFS